jgi:hypothetical protein
VKAVNLQKQLIPKRKLQLNQQLPLSNPPPLKPRQTNQQKVMSLQLLLQLIFQKWKK